MKKLIAASVLVGAFTLQTLPTYAYPTTVYTTTEDFGGAHQGSGWTGNTAVPSTAWDYDGSAVNGAGNATPGGAGTAGSLAITPAGAGQLGWTSLDEQYVGSFSTAVLAFDPGFSGGNLPGATGILTMVYTLPDNALAGPGTYFQPMIGFNMTGYWNMWGPDSTTSLGLVGGLDTYQATFSYTVPTTPGLGYFNLMLGANSDYAPIDTFYYDNIVITEATVVPEPSTMALLGMGALTVGFLARRSRKS